jgi:hypothetical protein
MEGRFAAQTMVLSITEGRLHSAWLRRVSLDGIQACLQSEGVDDLKSVGAGYPGRAAGDARFPRSRQSPLPCGNRRVTEVGLVNHDHFEPFSVPTPPSQSPDFPAFFKKARA